MPTILRPVVLIAVAAALSGCDATSTQDRFAAAERRIAALEEANKSLQSEATLFTKQLEALQLEAVKLDTSRRLASRAHLTPGSEGYELVSFELGVLVVSLHDVVPYANGSKITLKFGNLLATDINGLNAEVGWGPVNEVGFVDLQRAKQKTVTFSETLKAGRWTTVTVVLDGHPPERIGHVSLAKLSHEGIQLLR